MAGNDCWSVRVQATALEREVATLRGVVAALRIGRARSAAVRATTAPWRWAVVAFLAGVAVTSAAAALLFSALC